MNTTILGIKLNNRNQNATELQNILTKYGCSIRSRIGLHDNEAAETDDQGIIILELTGYHQEQQYLEKSLKNLEDVQIQKMSFA